MEKQSYRKNRKKIEQNSKKNRNVFEKIFLSKNKFFIFGQIENRPSRQKRKKFGHRTLPPSAGHQNDYFLLSSRQGSSKRTGGQWKGKMK